MNKLASAANDGIDPATYFPWHANALALREYRNKKTKLEMIKKNFLKKK